MSNRRGEIRIVPELLCDWLGLPEGSQIAHTFGPNTDPTITIGIEGDWLPESDDWPPIEASYLRDYFRGTLRGWFVCGKTRTEGPEIGLPPPIAALGEDEDIGSPTLKRARQTAILAGTLDRAINTLLSCQENANLWPTEAVAAGTALACVLAIQALERATLREDTQ